MHKKQYLIVNGYISERMDLFIGTKRVIIGVKFAIFLQISDYNFYVTWYSTKIIPKAFEACILKHNSFK